MCKQINLNSSFTLYIKINLKWSIDVNIRANVTKFLEEIIREKNCVFGLDKDFSAKLNDVTSRENKLAAAIISSCGQHLMCSYSNDLLLGNNKYMFLELKNYVRPQYENNFCDIFITSKNLLNIEDSLFLWFFIISSL